MYSLTSLIAIALFTFGIFVIALCMLLNHLEDINYQEKKGRMK